MSSCFWKGREGRGGREPHIHSHLKPSRKTQEPGTQGGLCPSSRIARKRRFLTRVLSQPTWHLASHLRLIAHNEHDAPEARPQVAISTLSSIHDSMDSEGGRCG